MLKVYLQYKNATKTWSKKKNTFKISGERRKVNHLIRSRQWTTRETYVKNILYLPFIRMSFYKKVKYSRRGIGFFSC